MKSALIVRNFRPQVLPQSNAAEPDNIDDDFEALEGEMAAMRDKAGASTEEAELWKERCSAAQQELAVLKARLEELETHGHPKGRKISMENGGIERNRSSAKVARCRTRDKVSKSASQARVSRDETAAKKISREEDVSSSEESEEDLDSEAEQQRDADVEKKKLSRELKMYSSKVSHIKTKEKHAKDERVNLKNRIKTLRKNMKDENRKYKELQREVKKMGEMMKNSDDEDDYFEDNGEDESDSEDESSEESESETETETESSDESETDDEDLPMNERIEAMQQRARRHEDNEKAVKKGNYMLKTTAERIFDQLRNEKDKYRVLERELNDLVNELQ